MAAPTAAARKFTARNQPTVPAGSAIAALNHKGTTWRKPLPTTSAPMSRSATPAQPPKAASLTPALPMVFPSTKCTKGWNCAQARIKTQATAVKAAPFATEGRPATAICAPAAASISSATIPASTDGRARHRIFACLVSKSTPVHTARLSGSPLFVGSAHSSTPSATARAEAVAAEAAEAAEGAKESSTTAARAKTRGRGTTTLHM
mmetsp:Transcript_27842/g.92563  ORF Transcript_27842/g.92563 Transcript_27842/m.92563 type:complete len:206 (+) Transcript_27842:931-1548(+)